MVNRDPRRVRRMFASIAPRYDLLNRILSLRIDQRWRRRTVDAVIARVGEGRRILDLCSGTADLALRMADRGRVVASDFCRPMLELGAAKASRARIPAMPFVEADALQLPFRDGSFEAVTVAFGLRNLADYEAGLSEAGRVMADGGVLGVLEFSVPTAPGLRQLYLLYFTRILPRIGRLLSGRQSPYTYLPESVREFPAPEDLAAMIGRAGFDPVQRQSLSFGIATLYLARRSR